VRIFKHRLSLAVATTAILISYIAPYVVSRCVHPETVLDYVGGHVIRPSFFSDSTPASTPDFTFDAHSRSFGSSFLTESFVSQSPVTRLASSTGWDVAGLLNDLYYPIARVDHLFTGRYCRFKNDGWVPFPRKWHSADSTSTVDLCGAELIDFEGFITRRP
jgi:hypothetical protein